MTNILVKNKILRGKVEAIPSKFVGQRVLILSAFSQVDKIVRIKGRIDSDDMLATIECLRSLGARIDDLADGYLVFPIMVYNKGAVLDCRESGATLRYLLPIVCALGIECTFVGGEKLTSRPINDLLKCLRDRGASFDSDSLPITVSGKLKSGAYRIRGDITSQFVSGMLMAMALIDGKSTLTVTTPIEAVDNVNVTMQSMQNFGVHIVKQGDGGKNTSFTIMHTERYRSPLDITIDGDWASSGTWLIAGAICGNVEVSGLNLESNQSDKNIIDILDKMGANIRFEGKYICSILSNLNAIDYDARTTPDLVPILSVACAVAEGTSRIRNVARLRSKNGNRLNGVIKALNSVGINAYEEGEDLIVEGGLVEGGRVSTQGDHRLVMMALLLGIVSRDNIAIEGVGAVDKVYPRFLEDFVSLGGKYTVEN